VIENVETRGAYCTEHVPTLLSNTLALGKPRATGHAARCWSPQNLAEERSPAARCDRFDPSLRISEWYRETENSSAARLCWGSTPKKVSLLQTLAEL
jgi:hypothetical protein